MKVLNETENNLTCQGATKYTPTYEDAKINYSAVWRVSNEVFTAAACEIFYVYKQDDDEKAYYRQNNGSIQHRVLPSNIYEFKKELQRRITEVK